MTLAELLTLLRESILNDRSDRVEGAPDFLWSDTSLITYINEAQRRFAVRSLILRDATTPEVTRIALVPGQSEYVLHESILAVMSVRSAINATDLTRLGHPVLAAYRAPTSTWMDPSGYAALQPGTSLAYLTDEGLSDADTDSLSQIVLRVYPTPSAAQDGDILRMRVVRKPIEQLSAANMNAKPELPEDHHIEMLDWAAYLALRIVDNDAGSPKRAAEFAAAFENHVTEARKTAMRKLFAPTGWGFGRGGWAWRND